MRPAPGRKETTMRPLRILTMIALLAPIASALAADAADAASAPRKATLAARANHQLRQADVPSAKADADASLATKADADLAARTEGARRPRLQVQRENLKGPAAAKAIAQQTNPNTIDRATAYGDKDHTQQVTDLKVTLQRKREPAH
jgi:hypothetical protein